VEIDAWTPLRRKTRRRKTRRSRRRKIRRNRGDLRLSLGYHGMPWGSMGNHSKTLGFPGFRGLWQENGGRIWNKTGSTDNHLPSLAKHCGGMMFIFCSVREDALRKIW
jgi:hypothetical protein